jgi:hypothetical protein
MVKPSLEKPWGLQEVQTPRISRQSADEGDNVVSPTHRPPLPPSPRRYPWYSFLYRLSRRQGHGAAGRIMSIKNLSGPIGNRTCDLPACRLNNSECGQKNFSVLPTAKVPRCPLNLTLVRPKGQSRCFGEQINLLPTSSHYAVPAGSSVDSWREWAVLVEKNSLLLLVSGESACDGAAWLL